MDEDVYYDGPNTLPLAVLACGVKHLEEFQDDMEEALEDEDISDDVRNACKEMQDQARFMINMIVAIASREIPEEDFLSEIDMMSEMSEV